jgi:hypothetical protein
MGKLKLISELGRDSAMAPFLQDFRMFSGRITTLFNYQPRVVRILAPRIVSLAFDGKTEHTTARVKKMKRPQYAMEPENVNEKLQGDQKVIKLPQIFQSASMLNDSWKVTFAGQSRMPMMVSQMIENFKQEENLIGLQGRGLTKGLISAETTDLGVPTGSHGNDTDGDGILEDAQADYEKVFDKMDEVGVGHLPVDFVFTPPLMRKLINTIVPYDPQTNNMMILKRKLNGGNVYSTGDLQELYSGTSNTFLAIVRTGELDAAWEILSSGLEQKVKEDGLWKTELGIREKFAIKILRGDLIFYMDDITTA